MNKHNEARAFRHARMRRLSGLQRRRQISTLSATWWWGICEFLTNPPLQSASDRASTYSQTQLERDTLLRNCYLPAEAPVILQCKACFPFLKLLTLAIWLGIRVGTEAGSPCPTVISRAQWPNSIVRIVTRRLHRLGAWTVLEYRSPLLPPRGRYSIDCVRFRVFCPVSLQKGL